jgi:hypothetical protein
MIVFCLPKKMAAINDEIFLIFLTEHDMHDDGGTSESEASLADSGLPATTPVTPSPISLDHEEIHGSGSYDKRSDKVCAYIQCNYYMYYVHTMYGRTFSCDVGGT